MSIIYAFISGNLKAHYKINHSDGDEKRCPKCSFSTSSKKHFREHLKTHKEKLKCTQCDFTCSTMTSLKTHVRNHNSDRPFQCHLCSYSSKQSKLLKKHIEKLHQTKSKNNAKGKRLRKRRFFWLQTYTFLFFIIF